MDLRKYNFSHKTFKKWDKTSIYKLGEYDPIYQINKWIYKLKLVFMKRSRSTFTFCLLEKIHSPKPNPQKWQQTKVHSISETKLEFESPTSKQDRDIHWVSDSRNSCQISCRFFLASLSYMLRLRFAAVEPVDCGFGFWQMFSLKSLLKITTQREALLSDEIQDGDFHWTIVLAE